MASKVLFFNKIIHGAKPKGYDSHPANSLSEHRMADEAVDLHHAKNEQS